MDPSDFFSFMRERHMIYLRRTAGQPWPWTEDHVLQTQYFTNVYRELDKVTVWFRENVRNPWAEDHYAVAWYTYVVRQFNRVDVLDELLKAGYFQDPLEDEENGALIEQILTMARPNGPWTNAAYIISTSGHPGKNKLQGICANLTEGAETLAMIVDDLLAVPETMRSVEKAVDALRILPGVGRFIGYEMATDWTHTCLLRHATDLMTWANPGPGARRGLNRVNKRALSAKPPRAQLVHEMRWLLENVRYYSDYRWDPPLTMREIEHSLCEYDKYIRAHETGSTKRRYRYASGDDEGA